MHDTKVEFVDENEDDQLSKAKVGKMKNIGDRHERGLRGDSRDFGGDKVHQNLGSIKMKVLSFQGRNDLKVFLE